MLLACKVLGETLPAKDAVVQIRKELRAHFDNEAAYIQNTHLITTKDRGVVPLRWNKAQRGLYDVIQHQRKEGLPIRVIITKARQQGCCYDPAMRVLTHDLRWVRIDSLSPGDMLVGCDENQHGGRGNRRLLQKSVVEATRFVREESFKVNFEDGRSILVTGKHRHLCRRRGGTEAIWVRVSDMVVGDVIRSIVKPWDDSCLEDYWLGGLLDGEGSLRAKPSGGRVLSVSQKHGPVYERAMRHLQAMGVTYAEGIDDRPATPTGKLGRDPVGQIAVYRTSDIFQVLGRCRPTRLLQKDWWEGRNMPNGDSWATVTSIIPVGCRRMVDLQTSTKTYICEGLVSHNSTFIQSWQYEQVDTNPFRKALTINFDDDNSSELFQKAKMIHDTNYCPRPTVRDSSHIIHFANPHGSIFQVQTAGKIEVARSLTVHHAHASEMPLWPDADTTFTAVNNAVPTTPNTSVIKESTARGAFGHHYEEWNRAERGESDYIPYFSPWYWQDEYRLPFPSKEAESLFKQKCSKKDHDYRDRYGLGWDQMHWRAWKMRSDLKDSAAIFDQEYPASASVAFLTTGLSVFDAAKVMAIEHECTPPYWIGDILLVSPSHSQQGRQP